MLLDHEEAPLRVAAATLHDIGLQRDFTRNRVSLIGWCGLFAEIRCTRRLRAHVARHSCAVGQTEERLRAAGVAL